MKIIPLRVNRVLSPGDDVIEAIVKAFEEHDIDLSTGDVLAVSVKVVSITMGYIVKLSDVEPSKEALSLSEKYGVRPEIAELIVRQGAIVIGGVEGALATVSKGFLVGNAGIDRKNVGEGYVALWPDDPDFIAKWIRDKLYEVYGVDIGVILVDSRVLPLRKGTVGFALGASGIMPIRDYRYTKDLFGYEIRFTHQNILDELASAAHLYMGEGREMIPFVYIKDAPIEVCGECTSTEANVSIDECLYLKQLMRLLDADE